MDMGSGSTIPRAPSPTVAPQRLGNKAHDVVGVETRLLGLGIDRNDAPGLVADQIDDGVGHLTLIAKERELAVDDRMSPWTSWRSRQCWLKNVSFMVE